MGAVRPIGPGRRLARNRPLRHDGARWVRLAPLMALALLWPAGVPPAAQAQGGVGEAEFTRDVLSSGLAVLVEERPGSG